VSDDPRAKRVTVVHPRTAAARGARRRGMRRDVSEQTELGVTLIRSLRRAQLRLAVIVGLVLAVTLGGIPLLFLLAPGVRDARVGGLAVGWLLLGVLVFPAICLGAWAYVRAAERNEAAFVELVERS
jgi:drug/metabolite transporter (DMT)-like permease